MEINLIRGRPQLLEDSTSHLIRSGIKRMVFLFCRCNDLWILNFKGLQKKREEIVVNSFHFPISRKNVRWSPILHYRIMVGCTVSVTWNAICKEDTFFRVLKTPAHSSCLECCLPLKSLLMQMHFIPRKTSTRSDSAINSGFGLDVKRIQGIRISFR